MNVAELPGWDRLRHGGLLLDPPRLRAVAAFVPDPLAEYHERELRRAAGAVLDGGATVPDFVTLVLEDICGFTASNGTWHRGSGIGADWGRRAVTGETIKPRQLWRGLNGSTLPVFIDAEPRLGIGRGRKATSQTVQWLRAGSERLALVTNGRQWRLVFAGLDFDAWCEWDVELWFEEGAVSPQVDALRALVSPALWSPPAEGEQAPLLEAILASRKGQAELSAVLGERVREAVELLVQSHGEALKEHCADVDPADIYRAAVRTVMRMVVVLFAESRELLPRDVAMYNDAYGLNGLLGELEKVSARGGNRLARSWNAWPRVLALFRLVHEGSHHPALPVPAYGGELFAPADPSSADGLTRALAVFETACFDRELLPDRDVHRILERITRTRVKVRQGRSSTWVPTPVDFSDLSSEYIGILYEGLLDFELRTAPPGDPVVFLAVGNQPALPLSRLEAMDDKALANLLEKLKDTSSGDAADEGSGDAESPKDDETDAAEAEGEPEEAVSEEDEPAEPDDAVDAEDERHSTRTRAEVWARRAVEVGKLARKPRGSLTPEKRLAYDEAVARKARQLVVRVVLPGEWYVVRWGGTRKGSGTFYTRPGLAVPTVQRTLRPLAYTPPNSADGDADLDAPTRTWTPKKPEEILALKVCDPACGSGTFPVSALRFLTEALYASLHHYDRIAEDGEKAVVRLLEGVSPQEGVPEERLGQELLPCRPEDAVFEPRLKAILRRHVVERSIYGVDIDPLAVELCRLALWIETMDRTLPFSFLDHKIKCGNGLVGTWIDQFQHYPVMAWKNREGGDKNHSNGVHFEKEARTKATKAFVKETLTPDLRRFLSGSTLFSEDLQEQAAHEHTDALATLARLHDLPVQDSAERARIYRDELLGSAAYRSLKAAMDVWCACWFWPMDDLDVAPLPTTLAAPPDKTRAVAERVAAYKRFFHWELEFPDAFRTAMSGFDAIIGNPPWDIAKPNSREFFSNLDPLYRSYGKQEALGHQTDYFGDDDTEREWLDYNADFRAQSNYVAYATNPFGDPIETEKSQDRFAIARGNENVAVHSRWREARARSHGFGDPQHAYRHQGSADLNLYKLFLEQAHALLCSGGRLGFIVPSGLYSDYGTGDLRRLFLDNCRWEWLFGFENREGIFDIHRSFKFNPVVVEKGGITQHVRTAFMRHKLEDWELAEGLAIPYTRGQVERFSPSSRAVLEITSEDDVSILETIYSVAFSASEEDLGDRKVEFAKGDFDMVSGSKYFRTRSIDQAPDAVSCWLSPTGERLLPLYEGRMLGAFDCSQKGWVRGRGRSAVWRDIPVSERVIEPQWLVSESDYASHGRGLGGPRVGFIRVTANTNTRTMYASLLPPFPTGFTACQLQSADMTWAGALELTTVLNSFVFDFAARRRVCSLDIAWFHLQELPLPRSRVLRDKAVVQSAAQLNVTHPALSHVRIALRLNDMLDSDFRPALTPAERLRLRCNLDAVTAAAFEVTENDFRTILRACDHPQGFVPRGDTGEVRLAKDFWRVDRDRPPELRHSVLTLIAFSELQEKIRARGSLEEGIQSFLSENDRQGWMLPESLRLADYDLGRDERAKAHQPVASCLGPRFYEWQLAQNPEESWRECHGDAQSLLGADGYRALLADSQAAEPGRGVPTTVVSRATAPVASRQETLFE